MSTQGLIHSVSDTDQSCLSSSKTSLKHGDSPPALIDMIFFPAKTRLFGLGHDGG